jgi:Leucine Rich Repeat (LRR) protein
VKRFTILTIAALGVATAAGCPSAPTDKPVQTPSSSARPDNPPTPSEVAGDVEAPPGQPEATPADEQATSADPLPGSGEKRTSEPPKGDSVKAEPPGDKPSPITTEDELRAAIKAKNPKFEGELVTQGDDQTLIAVGLNDPAIEDISPLAGLPLRMLDLSECHIADISPLAGMPLQALALENTGVADIGALKGMPLVRVYLAGSRVTDLGPLEGSLLTELNLLGTQVKDLKPLAKMRSLKMLWLNDTPVSDISPLAGLPLVSVTLAGTKVSDLGPLEKTGLQRLHIARSDVTDLSPLKWMKLTRLVFTPERIKTGMEYARQMGSISEIGTSFGEEGREDRMMRPQVFWRMYDAGKLK